MYIHETTLPSPAAQTDFAARFSHQVGLNNITFSTVWNLPYQLDNIFPFFYNRLWKTEHVRDLQDYTIKLLVEVIMVVDDAQMGMPCPSLDYLLVQFTG